MRKKGGELKKGREACRYIRCWDGQEKGEINNREKVSIGPMWD